MSEKKRKFCVSRDGELYSAGLSNIEDAVAEAIDGECYILGVVGRKAFWLIDANDIEELLLERLAWELGEASQHVTVDIKIIQKHLDLMLSELGEPDCFYVDQPTEEEKQRFNELLEQARSKENE